jgi:putative transposase
MNGPRVINEKKLRKSYLFAVIDDHSRLIPHAKFYLSETIESLRDCLLSALAKRGLPRRLYADYTEIIKCRSLCASSVCPKR